MGEAVEIVLGSGSGVVAGDHEDVFAWPAWIMSSLMSEPYWRISV
jgi:hypothetical protein